MNIPLNASFGIFAFLPEGWIFMLSVILLESIIISKLLYEIHFAHALRISLVSNIVSGIAGILISIALNGGSWLVVWFPWVSGQELHPGALLSFVVYYAGAFILALLLEYSTNYTQLAIRYSRSTITLVTLITNAISYVLGSVVLYSYSFN